MVKLEVYNPDTKEFAIGFFFHISLIEQSKEQDRCIVHANGKRFVCKGNAETVAKKFLYN